MADLLDIGMLRELVGDDVESFLPIIEDFQENGAQLISKISVSAREADLATVRAAAHQLKGSSGMLGMTQLYESCKEIESLELSQIDNGYVSKMTEVFNRSVVLVREALNQD